MGEKRLKRTVRTQSVTSPLSSPNVQSSWCRRRAFALTMGTDQLCFAVLRMQWWAVAPGIGLTHCRRKRECHTKRSLERDGRRLRQSLRFLRRLLVTNRHGESNGELPETVVQCRTWCEFETWVMHVRCSAPLRVPEWRPVAARVCRAL